MASAPSPMPSPPPPGCSATRFDARNRSGQRLAGLLVEPTAGAEAKGVVVLCHGFRSTKMSQCVGVISQALNEAGYPTVRFDFSGNGESEGEFATGNYSHEADDLRSIVEWVREQGREVLAVVGHSKGGNAVLLYAARYGDVPKVINVSGRYDLSRGLKERFGEDGMARMEREGSLLQEDKYGSYAVTWASIQERLATDMAAAARSIPSTCRVCTIHGTKDATVPAEDAGSFDAAIAAHELKLIEGACHNFRVHTKELGDAAVAFISSA